MAEYDTIMWKKYMVEGIGKEKPVIRKGRAVQYVCNDNK